MQALDFSRSFVTFTTFERANNARIQVEARCLWTDVAQGATEELFLIASCKSEYTYAKDNLFQHPNYDFCGVFNEQQFCILRTHASAADDKPEVNLVANRFDHVSCHIVCAEAELLSTTEQGVAATLAGKRLAAATEIESEDGRLRCRLEYPVKTMNANDIEWMYQIDTGPVPYPTWSSGCELIAGRFELAYVAWNAPHFADFVIQRPTELGAGIATPHYSGIVSVPARNELFALD